jgi:hypothetical protein
MATWWATARSTRAWWWSGRGGGAGGGWPAVPPALLGIGVTVKLACTDFGIPNLYVVGDDRGTPTVPIQVTSCGEAAHPSRARSLRKALLEFCGSRSRKAATHGPIERVSRVMPPDYVEKQMAVAMLGEERAARWRPWPSGWRRTRRSCAGASRPTCSPNARGCRSRRCPTPRPRRWRIPPRASTCCCNAWRRRGWSPSWWTAPRPAPRCAS